MSQPAPDDWQSLARAEGVDPAEVRLVFGRYQAHVRYHRGERGGEPLPIETWFGFYHREAASEAHQNAPAASGCSVDPGARNRGAVARPEAFLRVLAALVAVEAVS